MSARPRRLAAAATALVTATVCAACNSASSSSDTGDAERPGASAKDPVVPVKVMTNARDLKTVPITTPLRISTRHGSLDSVRVSAADGTPLKGTIQGDRWRLQSRLEPGTAYVATVKATRTDGEHVTRTLRFRTEDLTLDEQTYASVAPLQGETVGVGMPVIVSFDVPVTDKASFEKHMSVTSTPAQPGSWHWMSDHEAHWRPKTYWQAGTDVHVDVDVNSIPAGGGVYGQESREVDFHVGSANVYKVNAQTHQMQVFSNGSLLRTIPITTGKEGFTTRSGTKVIIEKFASKRMNSETVGIASDDPEAYDIEDVKYAMRVTYSGEFIHAAPWSVGSQGYANVSHGCTGMSTANAEWLYAMTKRGDVVEYTGTDEWMTLDNGYGDWNEDFATYAQGSALS